MPATPWTPLSLAAPTAYSTDFFSGVIADWVVIFGALIPVDADGNPVEPVGAIAWTELTLAGATPHTELSTPSTPYTELSL